MLSNTINKYEYKYYKYRLKVLKLLIFVLFKTDWRTIN